MEGSVAYFNTVAFKPRKAGSRSDFTAQPIRVHFHQLLQLSDSPSLAAQVENRDVLSALVALLAVSFPEMDPEEIYDLVSSPEAQSIILLRHHADVLEEYRSRGPTDVCPSPVLPLAEGRERGSEVGRFSQVFSDSDSDDSSEEAEDSASSTENRSEWKTFDRGVRDFLLKVRERRTTRYSSKQKKEIPPTAVGAESLIVAAATYKLRRLETAEKVLELSLLTTRRRYRKCGVGRYLVELLKTPAVCGPYEAFLALAESNAINFFTNCGLIDDVLLNDKFSEVRDEWTNTTLMSYLPPFSIGLEDSSLGFSFNLWEVELEVNLMRKKALLAYQQQVVCVTRLVQEVNTLREQMLLQMREVKSLKFELELERKQRNRIEQQFLEYRLMKTEQLLERPGSDRDELDCRVTEDSWSESA